MGRAARMNPNVELAREGKLPPRPKKMSRREYEEMIMGQIQLKFYEMLCRGGLK